MGKEGAGNRFYIIGASMSEPHTSELNGGISLICVYMYCTLYVQCTRTPAAYGHYTCASTTHAHLESSVPNSSVATCSEHKNSGEYFPEESQNHRNIGKTTYGTGRNERGLDVRQRQPSKD